MGLEHYISIALYVPELKSNLIGLGQSQEKGFFHSYSKECLPNPSSWKGLMIQVEMASNRMFSLKIKVSYVNAKYFESTIRENASWLWHLLVWKSKFQWFENFTTKANCHWITGTTSSLKNMWRMRDWKATSWYISLEENLEVLTYPSTGSFKYMWTF